VTAVPTDQLVPSASNPRRSNRPAADDELLESIRQRGILTPLLVRPLDDAGAGVPNSFEIVAGHRRYAAALELGLPSVPVTLRELSDEDAAQVAIIENLQREDIAPLDEAEAYDRLLLHPGVTVTEVAAQVGKSPAYVGRRLKLLLCIPELRDALREGRIDVARAELLAKLHPEVQAKAMGDEDDVVWNDFLDGDETAGLEPGDRPWQIAENLTPIAQLRAWVKRHTALNLRDLAEDAETRELFPEAAELMDHQTTDYNRAGAPCDFAPLLEVALDEFQRSPRKENIPEEVLVLGTDFRQVVGKPCAHAEKAVVVFGELCGDVVTVCRAKKACPTHWPPKVKKPAAAPGTGSASAERHQTWQEQEAARKHQAEVFELVKPVLVKAVIVSTAKVQTTPKVLQAVLENSYFDQVKPVLNVVGKLTPATFGRAWTLADALSGLYNARGAEEVIADLKLKFDLPKAMKDAEAALKAETDAKVKAPGLAKQKADQARAKAPSARKPAAKAKKGRAA
jgi:ParB/RepB/Spo0J family partition protein